MAGATKRVREVGSSMKGDIIAVVILAVAGVLLFIALILIAYSNNKKFAKADYESDDDSEDDNDRNRNVEDGNEDGDENEMSSISSNGGNRAEGNDSMMESQTST